MDALQFLQLVTPSPGHGLYCAFELKNKGHQFAESFDELVPTIEKWVAQKRDVYFALATFDPVVLTLKKDRRVQQHACFMRALFIDVDAGPKKKYPTIKDAGNAIAAFAEKMELPQPTYVRSGGGVHAYWPFNVDLPIAEWQPIAESLKSLCQQEALHIDTSITIDSARVLRVPGTFNFKQDEPRAVKLMPGAYVAHDPYDLLNAIKAKLNNVVQFPLSGGLYLEGDRPDAVASSATKMAFNGDPNQRTVFAKLREVSMAGSGCDQLKDYFENPVQACEPRWRGFISWAKVCVDGEEEARALTALHPRPEQEFRSKYAASPGPIGCKIMEREEPTICRGCKHYNKFTNPLVLARETLVAEAGVPQIEPPPPVEEPELKGYEASAPWGYSFGQVKGTGIYGVTEIKNEVTGEMEKKHECILPFELYVIQQLHMHGGHQLLVGMNNRGRTRELIIPSEALVSKDLLNKALLKEGIIPSNQKAMFEYMNASARMVAQDTPKDIPEHYGWQEDGSFAFSGHIFRANRAPLPLPATKGLENLTKATARRGEVEAWRAAIQLFVERKMWKHLALIMTGMAAPFMCFTEFAGITVHAYSKLSGTGKSLSQFLVASVWGDYRQYKTSKSTSYVAMQQRMGLLGNMPFIVDEITENTRRDPEWFPNFLLAMTDGKGKDRMEAGTNTERVNNTSWSTVALMSSNTPALQMLRSGRNHSAEGELMRLVELTVDDKPVWGPGEKDIISKALETGGTVGWVLAQFMVDKGRDALRALVKDRLTKAGALFKMNDDERYWTALLGAVEAAFVVLRTAGIIDLPAGPIREVFNTAFNSMRATVTSSRKSAEDVLESYIMKYYSKMITFTNETSLVYFADGRASMSEITGRVETDGSWTTFFLPRDALVAHCSAYSYDYEAFKKELEGGMDSGFCEGEKRVVFLRGTKAKTGARTWALKVRMRNDKVPDEVLHPEAAAGDA